MDQDRQLDTVYRRLRARFQVAGLDVPGLDARLLIQHVCGLDHAGFVLRYKDALTDVQLDKIGQAACRRLAGEPVSRILGYREFFGHPFALNEETLDPRADSEILVETAIRLLEETVRERGESGPQEELRVLDIGTGSGALIISLLVHFPQAQGVATDINQSALRQARENAQALGVAGQLECVCTSWAENIRGAFDLIISNPPYIPAPDIAGLSREVRLYDPLRALDGGQSGLEAYRALIPQTRKLIKQKGHLLLEIGRGQEKAVTEILEQHDYRTGHKGYTPLKDLGGIERCILALPV